jgi:hypothetical protein
MSRSEMEVMKAADMDVRPGQRVARAQPQRAPASRLARLLLLSDPKRSALVLLLMSMSMSACIIPLGPEFRDPPGSPNASPIISSPRPEIGWVSTQSTFEISVEDPNVEDTLYLRWIVDYPPFTLGTTVVLPIERIDPALDGRPRPEPELRNKTFACVGVRPLPTHQIMVIVSDREFLTGEFVVAAVPEGARTATATWTWDAHDCPQ